MVEGEPDSKHNTKCDVKDDRRNGCGSKDLELARLGTKGKTLDPERGSFEKADFEKAIELTGYGKFHYFLLAVCGFVSTSEEMDVISMSFILPSAQCDLKLNTQAKGWLNSIIFIGMMAGAYVWGSVADALGRRKVLITISFMNAICIVASSFSQSYSSFMIFRFLNGAALGGSGPVIWSYFAEFQPKSKRGSMLSFMAAFWTLGNLFVAGLAWLIIPHDLGIKSESFTYNSWRIFLLICAAPSFIVAGLMMLLPESPKYLLSRGRQAEALEIFRKIFSINTGKPRSAYVVKELLYDEFTQDSEKPAPSVTGETEKKKKSKYWIMFGDILDNSKQLFVPPILRFTIISIAINFTFHIGYYGLMMWFPELLTRFDEYAKDSLDIHALYEKYTIDNTLGPFITKSGTNMTDLFRNQSADDIMPSGSICRVTEYVITKGSQSNSTICMEKISTSVFMESLIVVAAAIPANIIAVLGMDRLGRKFFLVFSTFSAGLCSIGLFFVYNRTHNLIVSAFFSGVISCGNAALDCLITEVFPTNLRATGVAISMVAARLGGIIGNVVIAQLLDTYCPAPTFIVAALLIGGGLLCLFLPNTTREPLS